MMTYEEILAGMLKIRQKIESIKKSKESYKIPLIQDYFNSSLTQKFGLKKISQKRKNIHKIISINSIKDNTIHKLSEFNEKEKYDINKNKLDDKQSSKSLKNYKCKLIINPIFSKTNINFTNEQNLKQLELGNIVNSNLFKIPKKNFLHKQAYNNISLGKRKSFKTKEISFEQNLSNKLDINELGKSKNEDNKCTYNNNIYVSTYTKKDLNINTNIYTNTNKNMNLIKLNKNINKNKRIKTIINTKCKTLNIPIPKPTKNNQKDINYKTYMTTIKSDLKEEGSTNNGRPYSNDKTKIGNFRDINLDKSLHKTRQFFFENKIRNKYKNIIFEENKTSFPNFFYNTNNKNKLKSDNSNNKLQIKIDDLNLNKSENSDRDCEMKKINEKIKELDRSKKNNIKVNILRNNNNDLLILHKTNSFTSYKSNDNQKPLSSGKRINKDKKQITCINKDKSRKKYFPHNKADKIIIERYIPKRTKNNNDDILELIN